MITVERAPATRRGSMALAIKRLTAPAHRTAEATVARRAPFASHASYAAYLHRLHGFYAAVEPVLFERIADLVPDAEQRRKLDLIRDDLRTLDVPLDVPLCRAIPRMDGAATAMGVAYVLEGKTLGSRFLLEEARSQLELDAGRGASFFAGYGARTGPMWRAYLEALERFVARHGQRAAVLHGAEATFACFTAWIAPAAP